MLERTLERVLARIVTLVCMSLSGRKCRRTTKKFLLRDWLPFNLNILSF